MPSATGDGVLAPGERYEAGARRQDGGRTIPTPIVPWEFLVLATVGFLALTIALNVAFRLFRGFFVTVDLASGRLVTPTLLIAGTLFVATLVGLTATGRLRPSDLGWRRWKFARGLLGAAGIWVGMQLIELFVALAAGAPPRLSPAWTSPGWAAVIGILLGQIVGTACAEETFFRGFLLPQLRLRLSRLGSVGSALAAVGVSQLIFALWHLPNLVLGNSGKVGTNPADIVIQLVLDFLIGVVFAGLYLRTGNLFLVIGAHALLDAGTSVVATPIDPAQAVLALTVLLLLATFMPAWRRAGRR